jgi:hypothetical protein
LDAGSKCRDSLKPPIFLNIILPKPYLKEPKQPKNEFGLPEKPYYYTRDVCKILNILPDTFRQRIYRGYYPEYRKIGVKRVYTLDQIKELIKITDSLIRSRVLSSGTSDYTPLFV